LNPFNGIERHTLDRGRRYLKIRIHSMELKARANKAKATMLPSLNPFNGIERAVKPCRTLAYYL